jgi:uncharacterized protein (DUF1330 family)
MDTNYKVAIALIAGIAIGGVGTHGLNAQAKSKKAYTVSELEILDAKAAANVGERVAQAQKSAGGRNFRTGGGKVTSLEGAAALQRVGITEWDSVEKAQAFFKSKAWTDLAPDRDKAVKTIRRYVVEERD